jgi:ankyrin repeat protein
VATVDREGRTSLHYAAAQGDAARVAQLLAEGADPMLRDRQGWTPLHFAAQAYSVDVATKLLEAGAEVDAQDAHGNTPLLRAVFDSRGRGEVIQLLRRRGADPHRTNYHGVSPVQLAETIANYPVAQFFGDLHPGAPAA